MSDKNSHAFFNAFYHLIYAAAQRLPQTPAPTPDVSQSLASIRELLSTVTRSQSIISSTMERLQEEQALVRRLLETDLRIRDARHVNQVATSPDAPLMPIPTRGGDVPVGFPETVQALSQLEGDNLIRLFEVYGLPQSGSDQDRRVRFAAFIGAPHGNL